MTESTKILKGGDLDGLNGSKEAKVTGMCSVEESGEESEWKPGGRLLWGLWVSNRSSLGRVMRANVRLEDVPETLEDKSWRQ